MEQDQNQSLNQNQENQSPSFPEQSPSNGVSFPTVGEEKKSSGAKTILIVGILILVAVLGFVIYKSASNNSGNTMSDESSYEGLTTPPAEQTVEEPTATPVPTAAIDKSKVQVQVLNGTGITGEAAYLQTQLGNLGYTNIKTGNSESTVSTTTVTFSSKLDSGVVSEITQKLNSIYQTVSTNTSSSATFDAVVVIGLRKGATPKPSVAPTAAASASPSASPTPAN